MALDLEPILGCRLVENNSNPYWPRRNDLNQTKICEFVDAIRLEQSIQDFVNKPIDATLDLLVSSKVLRQSGLDTICIKVNHSVCDASGLKQYVSVLSNLYTKQVAGGKLVAQPNLGRRDQTQLFEKTKDPKTLTLKGFPKPTWTFAQKPNDKPMHAFRTLSKY